MKRPFTLFLALFVFCSGGIAQQHTIPPPFEKEPNNFLFRWDSVHHALVFYRDVNDPLTPAIRVYQNGTRPGPGIPILRDFPDAKAVDIWSVTAGPHGSVLASVVLQYGGLNVRYALLSYDYNGVLRKVWDLLPYHQHQIATDAEGNVYAFGHRTDRGEKSDDSDYPMLMKYAPDGKVVWEALSRRSFPPEQDIAETNAATGEHKFFIEDGTLVLYVAATKELLRFDLHGKQQGREDLSVMLRQITTSLKTSRVDFSSLACPKPAQFLAQLRHWPANPNAGPVAFSTVRFVDGSSWTMVAATPFSPAPGPLLGRTRDGKAAFLMRGSNNSIHFVTLRAEF